MLVAHGTYTSDGLVRDVTPAFGRPDVVRIRSAANSRETIVATRDMPSSKAKTISNNVALGTRVAFTATGFQLPAAVAYANVNGEVYHWQAFKVEAGDSAFGYYDGAANGTDPVAVTGLGWNPQDASNHTYILILPDATKNTPEKFPARNLCLVDSGTDITTGGLTLDTDGFTVGSHADLNGAGVRFYYYAFKTSQSNVAHGTYTSGASGTLGVARELTTASWAPDYAEIHRQGSSAAVERYGSLGATEGCFYLSTTSNINATLLDTLVPSSGFGFKLDPAVTDAIVWSTSVLTYDYLLLKNKADVVAPTVVSVTPTTGATGQALGTQVVLTFSEVIAVATRTLILLKQGASSIAYSGVWNDGALTWTMTPSSLLVASTVYTPTVPVTVTDVAGNAIASQFTSTFTTGAADTSAPTLSAIVGTGTGTTTATITFTTSEAGTTEWRYGTTSSGAAYQGADPVGWVHPAVADVSPKVTSHTIAVTGLTTNTAYYAQVRSANADGYISAWSDVGAGGAVAFTASNAGASVVTAVNFHATFEALGVEVVYTGDADLDLACDLFTVTAPSGASASAAITVTALPHKVWDKSLLMFTGGVLATVNGDHNAGVTTLNVSSAVTLAAGATALGSGFRFKRNADTNWRYALGMHRVVHPTYGSALYGAALMLVHNTAYDIHLTLADAAGVTIPTSLTATRNGVAIAAATGSTANKTITKASISTRNDGATEFHNVDPTTLTPTHYVRADGNDSNAGTADSAGGAWLTLEKVAQFINADVLTTRLVIKLGAGHFLPPTTTITNPTGREVLIHAANPAVNDSKTAINAGTRTIVENRLALAGPAGAAAPATVTPWVSTPVPGANYPGSYTFYKWTGGNPTLANLTSGGYGATRAARPKREAVWNKGTGFSAGRYAELMYENFRAGSSYHYGYFSVGGDIYLRMHGDANPNLSYWLFGGGGLFALAGPNIRIDGIEMRAAQTGINKNWLATNCHTTHCLAHGITFPERYEGQVNSPPTTMSVYGADHVGQYNIWSDDAFTSADQVTNPTQPWGFVKGGVEDLYGSVGSMGGDMQGGAPRHTGGAKRVVCRHNLIDGIFNGPNMPQVGYDKHQGFMFHMHNNTIQNLPDDGFEPEGFALLWLVHHNRFNYCVTFGSLGPVHGGPFYIFRNEGYRIGKHRLGLDGLGNRVGGTAPSGKMFKHEPSPYQWRAYVYHNTVWTDDFLESFGVSGALQSGGSGVGPIWHVRNNIIRVTSYCFDFSSVAGRTNESHNHFTNGGHPTRGLRYAGSDMGTATQYRAASGQGVGTNLASDNFRDITAVDAALTAPTTGDFALVAGSVFRNAGIFIPNISDSTAQIVGIAPDMGATEQAGADVTAPSLTSGPTAGTPAQTTCAVSFAWDEAATVSLKVWVTASGEGASVTFAGGFVPPTAQSITATGLTANTPYTCRAIATDAAGNANTTGGTTTFTTASGADVTAPTLSGFVSVIVDPEQATVSWVTNELASSQAQHRVAGDLVWTIVPEADTSPRVLAHIYPLTGLIAESAYEWQARSTDGSTNQSAFSATQTFSTPAYAPTVTSVTPATGQGAGGATVVIVGTGFQVGVSVTFGGILALAVTRDSATQLTVTTPPSAAGLVNVAVENPDNQSAALADAFTFTTTPTEVLPTLIVGTFAVTQIIETVTFVTPEPTQGNFEYGIGAAFDLVAGIDASATTDHSGTLTLTPGRIYLWRYVGTTTNGTEVQSATRAIETVGASGRTHRRGGLLRI